jgi:hypothetical protein
MNSACGMHGRKEKFVHRFSNSLKQRDDLEKQDVDGRIVEIWSQLNRMTKCRLNWCGCEEECVGVPD